LGIFIFGESKGSQNTGGVKMVERKKKERDEPEESIESIESIENLRNSIKRHQRLLEPQARLFILASAFEMQFGGQDVAAIGWLLVKYCEHQDRL